MTFKYERLPIFCHYCVLLGHDLCQCTQHFAMKKNGDGVEYQYGDWLKSLDGRPRSPSRRDTSQSNGFDNDAGDIPVHKSSYTLVVEKLSAAELVVAEHPKLRNCHDEGKPMIFGITLDSQQNKIQGIVPDSQQVDIINIGINDNVNEGATTILADVIKGDLISKKKSCTAASIPIDIWAFEVVGPRSPKSQAKWTRYNRMDFGLSGINKALNLPTLGKRGSLLRLKQS